MIGMSNSCESDANYPILANTETASTPLTIQCGGKVGTTNLSRFAFQDWKSVEAEIKGAHRVGFAIPMQSDQFKVVRFSLDGCARATAAMEAALAKVFKPKDNTRDTVL
jgi:hypothetical protein